jgi:hypothetical protein
MADLVTQAEFARRRGVSRKTVTKWKQAGKLVMQGELVDVEASEARLAHTARADASAGAEGSGAGRSARDANAAGGRRGAGRGG